MSLAATKHLPSELEPLHYERMRDYSDDRLVAGCREGDRSAFEALYERYRRRIYRFAFSLCRNHEDAEDLAAESWERAFRFIGRMDAGIAFQAWIDRIVLNRFRDMRRAAARRGPPRSFEEHLERYGERHIINRSEPPPSPETQVEANEREAILSDAIYALPPYQRTMIDLFHRENRTYSEIARLMKIPIGTVKSRLSRARDTLLELLSPQRSALLDE